MPVLAKAISSFCALVVLIAPFPQQLSASSWLLPHKMMLMLVEAMPVRFFAAFVRCVILLTTAGGLLQLLQLQIDLVGAMHHARNPAAMR